MVPARRTLPSRSAPTLSLCAMSATESFLPLKENEALRAEELLAGSHPVDHLSTAVPALREEWKRLNAQAPAPPMTSMTQARRPAYTLI